MMCTPLFTSYPKSVLPNCNLYSLRDSYLGRIAAGRVASGSIRVGDKIRVFRRDKAADGDSTLASKGGGGGGGGGGITEGSSPDSAVAWSKVTRIFKRVGMIRTPVDEAIAGDIVAVAGSDAGITDTLAGPGVAEALDPGHVDPPTLRCGLCHIDAFLLHNRFIYSVILLGMPEHIVHDFCLRLQGSKI